MNDLAEKALEGLAAGRRQVAGHPLTSLAVGGALAAAAVVITGGAVADARPTRTLTSWLGLQADHGWRGTVPGALLLAALAVLVLAWLVIGAVLRRIDAAESRVWAVVAATTAPFALGPPLMDTGVYSSAAFGFLQRAGRDPSSTPPSALGNDSLVNAIDPASRDTVSAAGPLGSTLQHLAVSAGGGTPLGAVIVLRVIGVLSAVLIARLAADLAADAAERSTGAVSARVSAIALCGLNPLVLLWVVSSPHLEGPMVAAVLAALVAARRRRWLWAVVLAAVAGSISGQALVVVPIVVVAHVVARRAALWRVLIRDLGAAVAVVAGAALLQPGGTGWVGAVSAQFSSHTPYSLPYAAGRVLAPVVEGASFDDLAAAGRISAATAATCAIAYLLWTSRHRSVVDTTGFALLTMALLSPNLYPWYLLWGLLCLAPAATGDRRMLVLTLSAAGCVLVPPGWTSAAAGVVTGAGLVLVALPAGLVALQRCRHQAEQEAADEDQRPPEISRTAGRTSAR